MIEETTMTDDQYERAKVLQGEIRNREYILANIEEDEKNWIGLPKEMFDRHMQEKRAFVQAEIERLKQEFSAL
jgi:hypothetical protein